MKRLVGLLVLVGTLLLGVGLWWILSRLPATTTTTEQPLEQSQEIGLERAALANAIIVSTADGLAAVSLENGNLLPVEGSFQRLQDPVIQITASSDDHYWLLETREVPDVAPSETTSLKTGWYLVDWQNNKLLRLRETFAAFEKYTDKQVASSSWISATQVGLVFAPIAESGNNPAAQQTFELAVLDVTSLQLKDLGSVQAGQLQLLGGNPAVPELYLAIQEGDTYRVVSRQAGTSQASVLIQDAQSYAYPYNAHQNQLSQLTENNLQLFRLPHLAAITQLVSTSDFSLEQTTWLATNGQVLATIERQTADDPAQINKRVKFSSETGEELYTLPITNNGSFDSIVVYLSGDGQTAVVKRDVSPAATDLPADEEASQVLYLVKVFEGSSEIIGNIPTTATILGVY